MAAKPEAQFIQSIHKRLRKTPVYYQSMAGTYTNGTPDAWYSGRSADLWVEYKFPKLSPEVSVLVPGLTALQFKWLISRAKEGRNVWVIVGFRGTNLATILDDPDEFQQATEFYLFSRDEIAREIKAFCHD